MTVLRPLPSPVGDLLLAGDGTALTGLYFTDHRPAPPLGEASIDPTAYGEAASQLEEWFCGGRTAFELALDPAGTEFQRRVWAALTEIPYGTTITYAELAARVGRPGAARAVGHAVARNPMSIVIPCHRVVGAGGSLNGYAGGIPRKRRLLAHEQTVDGRLAPALTGVRGGRTSAS